MPGAIPSENRLQIAVDPNRRLVDLDDHVAAKGNGLLSERIPVARDAALSVRLPE